MYICHTCIELYIYIDIYILDIYKITINIIRTVITYISQHINMEHCLLNDTIVGSTFVGSASTKDSPTWKTTPKKSGQHLFLFLFCTCQIPAGHRVDNVACFMSIAQVLPVLCILGRPSCLPVTLLKCSMQLMCEVKMFSSLQC